MIRNRKDVNHASGRVPVLVVLALLALSVVAQGQTPTASPPGSATTNSNGAGVPRAVQRAIPTNPSDPVAVINGQVITRSQLADECVARKGEEILETLVARVLIDQALRQKKLEVTPTEVNDEIESVARRMGGISRQAWLRTLEKERGISPIQYARDIIYPTLALQKLSASKVQVTPKEIDEAYEAQYGDKLRCRLIMVDKLRAAQEVWAEIKRNPGGFEKIAMERSIDLNTKSLGGVMPEPIVRHAFPRTVSDAAFTQLVDGDPKDTNPTHKPKDGDITGPIQVSETSWIILRRDSVLPAQNKDKNNAAIRKELHDLVFQAKLREKMSEVYNDMVRAAAIQNRITGFEKLANEDRVPGVTADENVQRTSTTNPREPAAAPGGPAGSETKATGETRLKLPPPPGVSAEDIKAAEDASKIQRKP